MLEVRLLGGFEIKAGQTRLSLPSRPAQSLFAFLILNAGTAFRREKLAGQLWPDSTEESARDYLRHALWRIRAALDAASSTKYLQADEMTIAFDASSDYWLDAAALRAVSEQAPVEELIAALSGNRGELLPGFYDEWIVLERENLNAVCERKLGCLLDRLEEDGRWSEILEWGEKWIAFGQKPEAAYRALMSAHAAKGEMSKVAALYERCVKSLGELGIEPSPQTRQLYESLRSGELKIPAHFPPARPIPAKPQFSNIPTPLTSFVGREKEIAEIVRLVSENRLVTLSGSGGVGKTRLAIESANKLLRKFRDGVYWVDLAALTDASLVPQALAKTLGVREVANQAIDDVIVESLRPAQALVVLDNCEHLVLACAQLADRLLSECKQLKMLVTSREALDILGETHWPVPSLSLPEIGEQVAGKSLKKYESVQLFTDRAALAEPGFVLTDDNAASVIQICRRLSGLPLAIELAAARVKIMSPEEIAAHLDDRFDLLTAGSRTAFPRHQTLRATIDWSYDLLSAAEQTVFRRLSAFAGGFTLDAAEMIASGDGVPSVQVIELLSQLINKSLVHLEQRGSKVGSETRYGMLESIREYGRVKLLASGEAAKIYDRHIGYFVRLAERAEPHKFGERTTEWFTRLDQELNNIRAGIDWAIQSGKPVDALLLLAALDYYFFVRGPIAEWQQRLKTVLSLPGAKEPTLARAKALNGVGMLYWADMHAMDGYPELQEALQLALQLGDQAIKGKALRNLGLFEHLQGHLESAGSLLDQSLEIWTELGPSYLFEKGWTLCFRGDVAFSQDEADLARTFYQESVDIFRGYRDKNFLAYSIRRLGQLAIRRGDSESAINMCHESLLLNIDVGDLRGTLACLAAFGGIRLALGQVAGAAELLIAVQSLLEGRPLFRLVQTDQMEFHRNLAILREKLTGRPFEKAQEKGRQMTLDQVIEACLKISAG